jgi:hypothetical protein
VNEVEDRRVVGEVPTPYAPVGLRNVQRGELFQISDRASLVENSSPACRHTRPFQGRRTVVIVHVQTESFGPRGKKPGDNRDSSTLALSAARPSRAAFARCDPAA